MVVRKTRKSRIYMSEQAKQSNDSYHTYIVPTTIGTVTIQAAGDSFVPLALEAHQVSSTVRIGIAISVIHVMLNGRMQKEFSQTAQQRKNYYDEANSDLTLGSYQWGKGYRFRCHD